MGFPAVPEPVRLTTSCVLLAASPTVSVPELGVTADGLNMTLISQAAWTAKVSGDFGQSSVSENSPVMVMLLTGCGDPPLLKMITDCGPLGFLMSDFGEVQRVGREGDQRRAVILRVSAWGTSVARHSAEKKSKQMARHV